MRGLPTCEERSILDRTPILGKKLWFGPRGFGWGWSPVSWEGWTISAIVFVLCIMFAGKEPPLSTIGVGAAVLGLIVVAVLKGTLPGSGADRDEFDRERRGPLIHGGGDDTPDLGGITRKMDLRRERTRHKR